MDQTFEVVSGKVVVTDPCYEADGHCNLLIDNAKKGTWHMSVDHEDGRVSCLEAICGRSPLSYNYRHVSSNIGVDSGQAGVFDCQFFKNDDVVKERELTREDGLLCPDEIWYSHCCDVTLSQDAGVIPYGCVSSTGYGDGCYDCYTVVKDGEVVAIKIVFIEEAETCFYCGEEMTNGECYDCDREDEEDEKEDIW
jgi:hypothetical protein